MRDQITQVAGVLAFFEIWNFPLTKKEIEQFLGQEISEEVLKEHFFSFQIRDTFYFSMSTDKETLLQRRAEGMHSAQRLQKKAHRFARLLKYFPFLRGCAVSNTVAMNISSSSSDIDLFLIVKKGHMWTARFLSTALFALLRLRPSAKKHGGKFCLSFYVDNEYTDFSQLKKEKDVYLAFWITTLQPLWGRQYFQRIQQQNATWIEQESDIGLKAQQIEPPEQKRKKPLLQKALEKIFGDRYKSFFKNKLQEKAAQLEHSSEILLTDSIQKLHAPDRREEIQQQWEENMEKYFRKAGDNEL